MAASGEPIPQGLLTRAAQVTDINAGLFAAAKGLARCIAGIHKVLRRQRLLAGIWCLDRKGVLSAGQTQEILRVTRAYPHLVDKGFVAPHPDEWLP